MKARTRTIRDFAAVFSDAHLAGDQPIQPAGTFELAFVEPPEDVRELVDE